MSTIYAEGTEQSGTTSATYRLQGPRALAPSNGAYLSDLRARVRRLTLTTAQRLKRQAQSAYSAYPTLAAGFQQVSSAGPVALAGITNTNPIFPFREYDTVAHDIHAVAGPYLRFYWPKAGRWVRTPVVHHPGTHGLYAIGPLFAAAEAAFLSDLDAIMLDVLSA